MQAPRAKRPLMTALSSAALGNGFAGYGVSSILILYLYESVAKGGLGVDKILSAQILSVYSSLGFIAGIIGSNVADRLIGTRLAYRLGMITKGLAIALLAIPHGGMPIVVISIIAQLFAAGIMGQSLNALTGALYADEPTKRDSAFALLYIMNNIGAAAPIITGTIALQFGYNIGFLLSAVVLLVTILPYLLLSQKAFGGVGLTPADPIPAARRKQVLQIGAGTLIGVGLLLGGLFAIGVLNATRLSNVIGTVSIFLPFLYLIYMAHSPKTTATDVRKLKVFITFLVANSVCMMVWNQSTGILSLYAADQVNLNLFGLTLTPASFQTVPAILAIVYGAITSLLWAKLGTRQPNSTLKFGLGTMLWGAGPLFMMIPLSLFPSTVKVSPLWLIGFYALIILGEALTSPIGYSVTTTIAPLAFATQLVTVYSLSQSVGAGLSTLAANFYTAGHEVRYFLIIGGITVIYGLVMVVLNRRIEHAIQPSEAKA